MKIYHGIEELIGKTPLLELHRLRAACGFSGRILAKLEYLNPAGSVKDRTAYGMLEAAKRDGRLADGAVLIEPTSGNTGIGLAMLSAVWGYRLILTMPENMSVERQNILKAYGAEIVLTPKEQGMSGAVARAQELAREIPGSFLPGQFENPANADAHRETTGPELWADTDGTIDALVAGVGTGGTLTGTGEYLKAKNPKICVVAAEPAESAVLSGEPAGAHGIQGIGGGFVPKVFHRECCDRICKVTTADAIAMAKKLAVTEGVLAGISSGAALCAAVRLAAEEEFRDKTIAVVLPDSADRYYSTPLFQTEEGDRA